MSSDMMERAERAHGAQNLFEQLRGLWPHDALNAVVLDRARAARAALREGRIDEVMQPAIRSKLNDAIAACFETRPSDAMKTALREDIYVAIRALDQAADPKEPRRDAASTEVDGRKLHELAWLVRGAKVPERDAKSPFYLAHLKIPERAEAVRKARAAEEAERSAAYEAAMVVVANGEVHALLSAWPSMASVIEELKAEPAGEPMEGIAADVMRLRRLHDQPRPQQADAPAQAS